MLCFIKNISLVLYSKSSVICPSQYHLPYKSSPQLMQVFSNPLSFSIFLKCIFPKTLFIKLPILVSLNDPSTHVENYLTTYVGVYFRVLYYLPVIQMSILTPAQYCFNYYFVISFEIRNCKTTFALRFQDCFHYLMSILI